MSDASLPLTMCECPLDGTAVGCDSGHGNLNVGAGRPQTTNRLWSFVFVASLFAIVSLLSTAVPAVNEPHYLCKAKAAVSPDWCERDFFLHSANVHYCFLVSVGWWTQWFSFPVIAVSGRVVSAIAVAFGWYQLSKGLRLNPLSACLSASAFVILSVTGDFSGEWILGGFESKVASWGFAMAAVGQAMSLPRSGPPIQWLYAGSLAGCACALHPIVGGWIAMLIVFAEFCRTFQIRRLLVFSAAVIVFALPGLIPAILFLADSSSPHSDRLEASMIQVFWRLRHHLDPTALTQTQWRHGTVAVIIILFRLWKVRGRTDDEAGRFLMHMFFGSIIPVAIGTAIGWHTGSFSSLMKNANDYSLALTLLKFYPFRAFDGLIPICIALFIGHGIQSRPCMIRNQWQLAVLALSLIAGALVWNHRPSAPPGYSRAQFEDWKSACEWIRTSTPADSLVLTPRESFAFKWFAERAEYVCYKDCPQDAAGILEWNRRLWFLHDWTLQSSSDGTYSHHDLEILKTKTGCDFLVTRILGPFETPPVWSGKTWHIYAVPQSPEER